MLGISESVQNGRNKGGGTGVDVDDLKSCLELKLGDGLEWLSYTVKWSSGSEKREKIKKTKTSE